MLNFVVFSCFFVAGGGLAHAKTNFSSNLIYKTR